MNYPLHLSTSHECSKMLTRRYSTSFSLGIRLLHKSIRQDVYNIYGFVRLADEIVDTFYNHNQRELFDEFWNDTKLALDRGVSLNPVLHAFQETVHRCDIPFDLIEAFMKSMEMDLDKATYNQSLYEEYIYGSAEVVGLMCLRVFCGQDRAMYDRLVPSARSLGSAFQKINFLRDMKSDQEDRGRVYFPGVDFNEFTVQDKKAIEEDIQKDFDHGLEGICQLPKRARFGVYLAYVYYTRLFKKISRSTPAMVKTRRIRIPDSTKVYLLFSSAIRNNLNRLA